MRIGVLPSDPLLAKIPTVVIDCIPHRTDRILWARGGPRIPSAKPWSERATALEQGHRRVVLDRRRIIVAHSAPSRSATASFMSATLQLSLHYELKRIAKTLKLAQTKTTLPRQNHSRRSVSPRLRRYLLKERWNLRSARHRLSELRPGSPFLSNFCASVSARVLSQTGCPYENPV